jgi:single-stranded-DNA-specific exonuclease
MPEWIEPIPVDVPDALRQLVGGHPLVVETLVRRGITDPTEALAFLNPDLYQPASPHELPNMTVAVERLYEAVDTGKAILIWGDFDVDGQTATTLLVTALREAGANVSFYIPHRQRDGHGIKVERLKEILTSDIKLIVTCDTGISEHEAIAYAYSRGVDVIVTDHHKLPETLPDAFACVNPQMLPLTHPLHTLPGVGCAYKLIEALYARLGYTERLNQLLDLVALGIVADVAVLTGDTRYLLQRGLSILRKSDRLGLKAMLEVAQMKQERIDEEQIGFGIAPRLNAVGRLGDANEAVELLSTHDVERAKILAYRFEALNNERKLLVQQVFDSAQKQIELQPQLLNSSALVLSHSQWAAGVLGIVANRLVEIYKRPVVLIVTPHNEMAHGSARSIAGCDITLGIASCSHVLKGYGGHTMAAGVRLDATNISEFRRLLSRAVESQIGKVATEPRLHIDGHVDLRHLSVEFVRDIQRLAPFGAGNPSLTLASHRLKLMSQEMVGRSKEHIRLAVSDETEHWQNVMWWQANFERIPNGVFDLAYTVHESDYKGKRELLVQYVDFRQVEDAPPQFVPQKVELVDYRTIESPQQKLIEVLNTYPDTCLWGDRFSIPTEVKAQAQRSNILFMASTLIIWTCPPDDASWQMILDSVKPEQLIIFAVKSSLSDVDTFLTTLSGMVKYAIRSYEGEIDLQQFVWITGQSEQVLSCAIDWLAAKGVIRIVNKTKEKLYVQFDNSTYQEHNLKLIDRLRLLFQETRAYGDYFQRTSPDNLLNKGV